MFDAGPSCFGKLPFNLIDRLQTSIGRDEDNWADAIPVPAINHGLTSIDTISLRFDDLPRSVTAAILHSINDIFAANGIPSSFSISMALPPDTDLNTLLQINSAIRRCAEIINCTVGKLHTGRVEGLPNATVCVMGEATNVSTYAPNRGKVMLIGSLTGSLNSSERISIEIAARLHTVRTVGGPKKDISGEGLIGTLYQLTRRHAVSIDIWEDAFNTFDQVRNNDQGLEKNYLDYAASVIGGYSSSLRGLFFAPHVFGPLVCLVDQATDPSMPTCVTIGSFEAGPGGLRVIKS